MGKTASDLGWCHLVGGLESETDWSSEPIFHETGSLGGESGVAFPDLGTLDYSSACGNDFLGGLLDVSMSRFIVASAFQGQTHLGVYMQ